MTSSRTNLSEPAIMGDPEPYHGIGDAEIYQPFPQYVLKPRADGRGVGLRMDVWLEPTTDDEGTAGGARFELASQVGELAHFGWEGDDLLVAKVGPRDIAALLLQIRVLRGKSNRLSEEHRSAMLDWCYTFGHPATAVEFEFETDGSLLRIGRSETSFRSIKLTLEEEQQSAAFMERVLLCTLLMGVQCDAEPARFAISGKLAVSAT